MLNLPLLLCLALPQSSSPDGHVRVAITGQPGLAAELSRLGYDDHDVHVRRDGDWEIAELIAPARELPGLRESLPAGTVIGVLERSRPYREIAAALRAAGPEAPDPLYKTPAEVVSALQDFERRFPTLAKVYDLQSRYGAPPTHDGNRIYILRISDNPDTDENEPNAMVFGNNHSRELNSIEAPLHAAERLLTGYATDPEIKRLIDENQIWIIANMNPDGLDHVWNVDNFWRKNRRDNGDGTFGVDLNRNYPYFWGRCGASTNTSSGSYAGPSALSEPESRAMEAFALAEGLERLIDIHSFSRDTRYPFNPLVLDRVPAIVRNGHATIHSAVANAMNYAVRGTCCCGTHMEWHHTNNGTLSLLVEMGDAFQPPFPDTVTELARLWPGIREFLTTPAPMNGSVRSIRGAQPIVAEVTVLGHEFRDGQKVQSIGRFGRYALWVGPGTYDVEFSAPGHVDQTIRVTLQAGQTLERDVWLVPQMQPTTLIATGTPRIGQTVDLDISSPDDPGAQYFMPAGFFESPALDLGFGRQLDIAPSFLLGLQLDAPTVFVDVFGNLDASGNARGQFAIPSLRSLVGLDFFFAGITLDPSFPFFVKGISSNLRLRIVP